MEVTATQDPDGRWTAASVTLTARQRTHLFGVVTRDAGQPALGADPHITTGMLPLTGDIPPHGQAVLCCLECHDGIWAARVVETLGDPSSPEALRRRVLTRFELPAAAPEMPRRAARRRHTTADTAPARRDLRHLTTITVDGPDSKDLDDALSVLDADHAGAVRVLVHIADVAEAVPAGSALDVEASASCTSVYFPGWNRPMLPRELSEEQLSLLPGNDKLALTVEMRITPDGQIAVADIFESVVRSTARLTYEQASHIIAGTPADPAELGITAAQAAAVTDTISWLRTASARLGVSRARRGGIDSRRIDPDREVVDVDGVLTERAAKRASAADEMIERLMVAANESVAGWMTQRGIPCLYRTHPGPDSTAAETLETFARNVGVTPGFGDTELTPVSLAAFASQVDMLDADRAAALWDVLVSKLGRATYQPEPAGHFSLGSDAYTHFTSPIRRYADLIVHRIVKQYLRGSRDFTATAASLHGIAAECNTKASVAKRAESSVRRAMAVAHLANTNWDRRKFDVRVTGFSDRGAFVQMADGTCSGFLPFSALPERYDVDEHKLRAVARGDTIEIGQQLELKVTAVDVERADVTFGPASRPRRRR